MDYDQDSKMDDDYSNYNTEGKKNTNTSDDPNANSDTPVNMLLTTGQQMPIMLTIVIAIYFITAPIMMLRPTSMQSGVGFLSTQMMINSSLLVTFSVVYGMMTLFFNKSIITTHQNILLPFFLIAAMWVKSYSTYTSNLTMYCRQQNENGILNENNVPYRWQKVVWNTSKVPIAIFITYIAIVLFPQSVVPFNQFFCGEDPPHPLVVFFSIGFWTGCATWAAEASCYFSLLQSGCQPADRVDFQSIDQVIRNYKEDK